MRPVRRNTFCGQQNRGQMCDHSGGRCVIIVSRTCPCLFISDIVAGGTRGISPAAAILLSICLIKQGIDTLQSPASVPHYPCPYRQQLHPFFRKKILHFYFLDDSDRWNTYMSLLFLFWYNVKTKVLVNAIGVFPEELQAALHRCN